MKFMWGFAVGLFISSALYGGFYWYKFRPNLESISPVASAIEDQVDELLPGVDLEELRFESIRARNFEPTPIVLGDVLEDKETYTNHMFTYTVDGYTVSGMANIPKGTGPFPVIIMLRGFVDPSIYQSGVGTWRAGGEFATEGYITLAPDFLGFGESDDPEPDIFWERFHKPVQVMQLLSSVETLDKADTGRIGIWGHSNGGQIAISVLEISQKNYPTTLWAPVTKPFPYSILYFTDESDDEGKELRKELADLENRYEVQDFSIGSYWAEIASPIQLHQGGVDEAVPRGWSDDAAVILKGLGKEIEYWVYPNADHNLRPDWETVVVRDKAFFAKHLKP